MAKEVMTVNELGDYIRIHRSTVYRLLKSQGLPAFKVGNEWRFMRAKVDEWRLKQQITMR